MPEHLLHRECSLLALALLVASMPTLSNAASIEEIASGPAAYGQWFELAGDGSAAVLSSGGSARKWTRSDGLSEIPGATVVGISGDGFTAVGQYSASSTDPEGPKATRWTADGAFPLDPGPAGVGWAHAASGDGSVIVGASTGSYSGPAFRWTQATGMVGIGVNGPAYDVSADASVVVGEASSLAFRWTADQGVITLPELPPATPAQRIGYSQARAVSADGSWVVGETNGQAFRWSEAGGILGLGILPLGPFAGIPGTEFSFARDVSDDGSVVVGSTGAYDPLLELPIPWEGFVWTASGGMQRPRDFLDDYGIDLTGWSLYEIYGISDDGTTLLGAGSHAGHEQVVWIATIPEPTTALLFALGLAGLAALRAAV